MREIELKFLIEKSATRELWQRARALDTEAIAPRRRKLRSLYFDTKDHTLRHAGISLRVRRVGRSWVQTVKAKASLHGGLSRVLEAENPALGGRLTLQGIPDAALRGEVMRRVNGAELLPVCETVVERQAGVVSLGDGTRAELAIDVGEIHAEGKSAPLCEAEIELIEGEPDRLFTIAKALLPEGGLRFSGYSKCDRGFLLAEKGYIEPPVAPRKANTLELKAKQDAAEAAQLVLRECLAQIAANVIAVRQDDDPEGPHQLRIGLRRLRSALSLFSPVLTDEEASRLNAEARWLGQEVGRVRDLDVVAGDVVRVEAVRQPDEPGLPPIADMVARAAGRARNQLRSLLVGARAQAFLLDLARFVETRVGADPAIPGQSLGKLADKALAKRWKQVRKHAQKLETLTTEEKHELRKKLKKLRYSAEFLAPLYPSKRVTPFLKRLRKLQEVFGDLNDAATVRHMADEFEARLKKLPHGERALGRLLGATHARAEMRWMGAKALWRKLEKKPPFWG